MKNYLTALFLLFVLTVNGQTDTIFNANPATNSDTALQNRLNKPTDITKRTAKDFRQKAHSSDSSVFTDTADSLFYITDTINPEPIVMQPDSSASYISNLLKTDSFWKPGNNSLRKSLENLLINYQIAYENARNRLESFEYDSIQTIDTVLLKSDTLNLRWLNDSTMFIDSINLTQEPFITKKTVLNKVVDTNKIRMPDSTEISAFASEIDSHLSDSLINTIQSIIQKTQQNPLDSNQIVKDSIFEESYLTSPDTITTVVIDTAFLNTQGVNLYHVKDDRINPPPIEKNRRASYYMTSDKKSLVVADSIPLRLATGNVPFYHIPGENTTDSLKIAVNTLIQHVFERDSIEIFIRDRDGRKTPFWLSANNNDLYRIWVKNYRNDSITIWMGNPEKHDLTLFLEEEVQIDRPKKQPVEEIPVFKPKPESNLVKIEPLETIPVYWDHELSTLFSFNQTYLANWSKGGESSVSTLLDIKGKFQYNNKSTKTKWINNGRLKYGSVFTTENGLRTSTDQLEINSQYNRVIDKELDFSTAFYMKSQIAPGYNYPNDSIAVSKFLNPGSFTLGLGIEFKPAKKTVINFSPASYKNTFVLDTVKIDQTNHGIDVDKMANQEFGGQLVAKNSLTILEGLDMSNSIRLFTNYFSKPLNMDVDWEFNLEKRVNWYFTIGLNLHVIYDKDIKFPVLDDAGENVLGPDDNPLKEPKVQFKEFIGLNFSFTF
ncbi:MAG TPA: DUF3078 domain-containing protein [Bacteroidales bacterium]|nr:DUF3078 domain-containing protein [Bacteroidales bacterium]